MSAQRHAIMRDTVRNEASSELQWYALLCISLAVVIAAAVVSAVVSAAAAAAVTAVAGVVMLLTSFSLRFDLNHLYFRSLLFLRYFIVLSYAQVLW